MLRQSYRTNLQKYQNRSNVMFLMKVIQKIRFALVIENEIFYINGSETLPPPLTREEEQHIMENIAKGDSKAREPLIVHNLRLVVYIAKKFETPNASAEDLISIGTIGLIKAVNTFSPEKNIKLATYASRCIENEILMHIRKTANQKAGFCILSCQNGGADILVSRMQSANGFHHSVDGLILQDVCKVVGHHGIGQLQVPAAQDLGNGHILPGGYDLVDALTHGTEAQ